jgi:hypothetical protein
MFTPETVINTIETAKLNVLEKVITNETFKDNVRAAIRAETQFAQTLVATAKNIADEVAYFNYAEFMKPYTVNFTNLFDTFKNK